MRQRLIAGTLSRSTASACATATSARHLTGAGDGGGRDGHDRTGRDGAREKDGRHPPQRSTPTPASHPSAWDAQRYAHTDGAARATVEKEWAADRLTQLFRGESARHALNQTGIGSTAADVLGDGGARLLLDDEGGGAWEGSDVQAGLVEVSARASGRFFDEQIDEDGVAGLAGLTPQPQFAATAPVVAPTPRVQLESLEQELLDDAYLFFPPALVEETDAHTTAAVSAPIAPPLATADARARQRERDRAAKEHYVPGQQIVPPGLTRYRVDVQYQGGDFDGWYKSTARQWSVVERLPDGTTRRRPASAGEAGRGVTDELSEDPPIRRHARTVLEEALAVAIDVPSVSVVAAAIPETGVSVRRLVCHVDLPSATEMQPRTIMQRATLWLQSHQQPLAILSCHPCRNQDFHARHSGVRRVYCYRILNRVAPPLFDAGLQWHVDRHLDVARMQRFAAAMSGTHDYGYFADPKMANALRRAAASHLGATPTGGPRATAAFSAEHEPLTSTGRAPSERTPAPKVEVERGLTQLERAAALPTFNQYGQRVVTYDAKPAEFTRARTNLPTVRTVDKVEVVRQEDEVLIWFVGQSFLRHQIRNMVSVLKAAGHGLWDERELQHALTAGFEVSRKKFKRERLPAAPAYGLTLWDVEYPSKHRDDYVAFVDSGPYEEVDMSMVN